MMPFDRHDRVRSLLSEIVATFIRNEANPNPLITVTSMNVAPNYRNVTVFITTIPNGGEEDALIFLKRKGGDLRGFVKKHSHMKIIPHFDFAIDYGERHRQHIDTIAQKIEKKEE
jgi:ribosome-binding factor A